MNFPPHLIFHRFRQGHSCTYLTTGYAIFFNGYPFILLVKDLNCFVIRWLKPHSLYNPFVRINSLGVSIDPALKCLFFSLVNMPAGTCLGWKQLGQLSRLLQRIVHGAAYINGPETDIGPEQGFKIISWDGYFDYMALVLFTSTGSQLITGLPPNLSCGKTLKP